MTRDDQIRWDAIHAARPPAVTDAVGPPAIFADYVEHFPTTGRALDLACGPGRGAVWLARRGLQVWGLDVSPVAIHQARDLAARSGVADRCRFEVADLDDGLPVGPPVAVVLCHKFSDRRLDSALIGRLAPGGLLAIAALSAVGATAGPFRVARGELTTAFAALQIIAAGEGQGAAWLLARAESR